MSARTSSSFVIYLVQVELQMVLISTVSTFFLSTLSSSFSCLDLVLEDPARSLRLRPLPCEQQQRHRESHKGANRRFVRAATGANGTLRAARGGERAPGVAQDAAGEREDGAALASPPFPLVLRTGNNGRPRREWARYVDSAAQQAGSNGLLRAAGPGKAARSSSSCGGGGEGEKQIDFAALKSTGCTQTVHQPAFRAHRPCRCRGTGRPGPAEGLLPAVIRHRKARRLPHDLLAFWLGSVAKFRFCELLRWDTLI